MVQSEFGNLTRENIVAFVGDIFNRRGDVLYGSNDAVNGSYVLGWSTDPQQALEYKQTAPREQVLLWHMNYHPDGGHLFFSTGK